jgi:opacity protein-like surface antigen
MQVRMLRGMAIGATAVLGLALIAPSAQAQAQTSGTRFGVEAAFGANDNVGIGVGAFIKFHLADMSEHPITARVAFDYFFPGSSYCGGLADCGVHYFIVSAVGLYDIANPKSNIKPYVGAGLEYTVISYGSGFCDNLCPSASAFGLDLVGGINFAANSKLMPFVELSLGAGSGSEFLIKGGIHF